VEGKGLLFLFLEREEEDGEVWVGDRYFGRGGGRRKILELSIRGMYVPLGGHYYDVAWLWSVSCFELWGPFVGS
jgi:hypothetical protein